MPDTQWYNEGRRSVFRGETTLESDTIRLALLTGAHVPDLVNDTVFGDVSANELGDAGYTAGGDTLTSKTFDLDMSTPAEVVFDAADLVWSSVTWPSGVRYGVAYRDAATARLLFLVSFGEVKTPDNENFAVIWNVEGISRLRVGV